MRDRWFGDNRDLIKWGGIKILCIDKGINKVLWVAYLREDNWTKIKFDDCTEEKSVPVEVVNLFKSIRKNLNRLITEWNLDIILIDNECGVTYNKENRQKYTNLVCNYIEKDTDKKKVVFLDPDTGLQPKRLSETTVAPKEVKEIWDKLNGGDYLVFYQHKSRDKEWIRKRKKALADICGLPDDKKIHMWLAQKSAKNNSAKLANDVAFFFLEKNSFDNNLSDINE